MTTKQIKEIIGYRFDTISKRNEVFTVRRGFFYTHGKTSEDMIVTLKSVLPSAKIIDFGENFVSFSGRKSLANQSHWWIKFTI